MAEVNGGSARTRSYLSGFSLSSLSPESHCNSFSQWFVDTIKDMYLYSLLCRRSNLDGHERRSKGFGHGMPAAGRRRALFIVYFVKSSVSVKSGRPGGLEKITKNSPFDDLEPGSCTSTVVS